MKEIKLSQRNKKSKNRHLVALVDDEDYEYLNQWNWSGEKHRNTFYAHRVDTTGEKNIKIKMHRLLAGVTDSRILVDHKDGNGLNNCKHNIRACNASQNSMNRKVYTKKKSSKYKGVHYREKGDFWIASIGARENRHYLGCFEFEKDAAIAYNKAAEKLYGEFANSNIIV